MTDRRDLRRAPFGARWRASLLGVGSNPNDQPSFLPSQALVGAGREEGSPCQLKAHRRLTVYNLPLRLPSTCDGHSHIQPPKQRLRTVLRVSFQPLLGHSKNLRVQTATKDDEHELLSGPTSGRKNGCQTLVREEIHLEEGLSVP